MPKNANGRLAHGVNPLGGAQRPPSATRLVPPILERKPDPAILFSILNAIAEITQIIVLIQKISQGRKERPGAEGELKLLGINPDALWFALGDWVWRLRLLLASINQPGGDLLVAEWSPSIEDDLESLCDTFREIFEQASIPAAALNSDLDTILRRCHQRAEGLRPIDAQAVLSPFVSASSGIWSELDSFRADLWEEWMVPRFARPSDWWEDPSDDSGPETPIYPPGWMVDVTTAGDDLLEPSENGTAAPSGDGRATEGSAKTPSGTALPAIGRAAREKIVKFFYENLSPAWKTLDEITRGVGLNSEKYTSTRLRELVKANVLEHQKGDGLWRLK